jgi:type 1 fimbria pilin
MNRIDRTPPAWVAALVLMSTAISAQAAPDNWGVEGAHGELHISGALSAGACRLDMTSLFQQVEMGVVPTAPLQRPGDRGEPVAVHQDWACGCWTAKSVMSGWGRAAHRNF